MKDNLLDLPNHSGIQLYIKCLDVNFTQSIQSDLFLNPLKIFFIAIFTHFVLFLCKKVVFFICFNLFLICFYLKLLAIKPKSKATQAIVRKLSKNVTENITSKHFYCVYWCIFFAFLCDKVSAFPGRYNLLLYIVYLQFV